MKKEPTHAQNLICSHCDHITPKIEFRCRNCHKLMYKTSQVDMDRYRRKKHLASSIGKSQSESDKLVYRHGRGWLARKEI